jgi:hypothetical protein
MKPNEVSILAGISLRTLNRWVDSGDVPGIRRKSSKRLEVIDEDAAIEWASSGYRKPRRELIEMKTWAERARKEGTSDARAGIELAMYHRRVSDRTIPQIAEENGVSRQAIYQAINRLPIEEKEAIKCRMYLRQRRSKRRP